MGSIITAALFFVGIHIFVAGTELRWKIAGRIGEEAFQAIFSVLSLAGIVWLSRSYRQAEYVELWGQVRGFRWLALVAMFLAFFFVVLAFASPNPTAVRGGAMLQEQEPARGIQRVTRHPFLWGVALWALIHLIFNGDLASLIFFGSLLTLALKGPASIDRKRKRIYGDNWERFAAVTSSLPFLAIAQGRNSLVLGEIGWWRIILVVAAYGFFLHMHKTLFGVSPFAG